MPRTIEGIVECHRAATERRNTGRPIWDLTIRIGHVWRDEALTFERRRDAIVAAIRNTRWSKLASDEARLADVLDNLAAAPDVNEFDGWWDELYDLADYDRVWIDTTR